VVESGLSPLFNSLQRGERIMMIDAVSYEFRGYRPFASVTK